MSSILNEMRCFFMSRFFVFFHVFFGFISFNIGQVSYYKYIIFLKRSDFEMTSRINFLISTHGYDQVDYNLVQQQMYIYLYRYLKVSLLLIHSIQHTFIPCCHNTNIFSVGSKKRINQYNFKSKIFNLNVYCRYNRKHVKHEMR